MVAGIFVANKLFISTRLGGALLNIEFFILCLYRAFLEINYLFHADTWARNYLFQKYSNPTPLEIEWWPPNCFQT